MPFQILLSLCFCFSFIIHVSALYSRVLNISTSYMRVFVALLSSLEFHTFLSACQVPLPNPILFSTFLSDPSCVLIFPPSYKVLHCSDRNQKLSLISILSIQL